MLEITIPGGMFWDEVKEEFIRVKSQTLRLEHSLVSISKWESKWKKPYISEEAHSVEETLDYIRCMTLTQNVDPMVYQCLDSRAMAQISEYINDSMTATWFGKTKQGQGRGGGRRAKEIITAEVVYYWMFSLGIPIDCQKWHFNKLMTLIKVFDEKNKKPENMSRQELAARNRSLNAARKARLHTKG